MKTRVWTLGVAAVASLFIFGAACGGGDNNGASNNGASNNGASNNGTSNNGTTSASNLEFCDLVKVGEAGDEASCGDEGIDHGVVQGWFEGGQGNEIADPQITRPGEGELPNLLPASGSPALSGAVDPGDAFFDSVDFRGAFGAENWAAGWSYFDVTIGEVDASATGEPGEHPNVECEEQICTISGTILEDLELTPNYLYLLEGGVFVGDKDDDTKAATLTIQPGVTVYGDTAALSFLTVSRGSQLIAEGTADKPIVFTSANDADGTASPGDWGGLIFNGKAPVNTGDTAEGEGGTGIYGGDDPADSSGSLKYVVVAYGGQQITSDNELNGIAFQGVGNGTTVDYVHVHNSKDDGVEFFGGTVNAKHILVTGIGDDNLDWTYGWQGKLQYFAAVQYSYDADNGIEADNNSKDNSAAPFSDPTISNVTLVGMPDNSNSDLGLLLREGTRGKLYNFVVYGFNEACVSIDQDATVTAATNGDLKLEGAIIFCQGAAQ